MDTFAVALIAYILITGDHPFASSGNDPNLSMVCRSIAEFNIGHLRLKYADWCWRGSAQKVSPVARDFIERIGNEFPERRLTVKDALEHTFITRNIRMSPISKFNCGEESPRKTVENNTAIENILVNEDYVTDKQESNITRNLTVNEVISPFEGEWSDSLKSASKKKQESQSKTTKCENTIDEEDYEEEEKDIFSSPSRGISQMIKFLV